MLAMMGMIAHDRYFPSFIFAETGAIQPEDIDDATGDGHKKKFNRAALFMADCTLFLEKCANYKRLLHDAEK